MSRILTLASLLLLAATALPARAEDKRPLLRFPDVHGNLVVFAWGGDLFRAEVSGGVATRLTLHDGDELYPRFSPDGSLIAFTGEYDGNTDVYVMNVYGGDIRRVTWHPDRDDVIGWHPTKNKIIFRSGRKSYSRFTRLFLVAPDGTGLEEVPLHEAAAGSFSPDGGRIAYNNVAREDRTWKRYRGGLAQEIWLYDFASEQVSNLSRFEGTDRAPMWIGNRVFFSSDRDGLLNLYSADPTNGKIEQHTRHTDYDVRRPSEGPLEGGAPGIVYEVGGALWLLDTSTGRTRELAIEIRADAPEARPHWKDVSKEVSAMDVAPGGDQAVLVARGDVFVVPKKEGRTANLTRTPGSREKHVAWSPDGQHIAVTSDAKGEVDLWLLDPGGKTPPLQLTSGQTGYRHTLRWSPDSKKIAYADHALGCHILDVESREITFVDRSDQEPVDISLDLKPIHDFAWSPDSRWLAYSTIDADLVSRIYLYSLDTGKKICASEALFNDFGPVFSRDGRHLFFVSNRRFDPTYCDFEWEMVYKKVAGIYCLSLREDGPALFGPGQGTKGDDTKNDAKKEDKEGEPPVVTVDEVGLAGRVEALPLPRGNYRELQAGKDALFFLDAEDGDFNRFEYRAVGDRSLFAFSLADKKKEEVLSAVTEYHLSADGGSIAYRKGSAVGIVSASTRGSKGEGLDTGGLSVWLDPVPKWTQIFDEAWRMERDFFYEEGMHGLDWTATGQRYRKLIPHASCRQDVRYLIGELIGELNSSHTYVFGGDSQRQAASVSVGMLGVDWIQDMESGRYRFGKIYRVPDWTRGIAPPLAVPGLGVEEGHFLFAVDGVEVTTDRNVYSHFQNLGNREVGLVVGKSPDRNEAREITVKTVSGEGILRYLDWVESNRQMVDAVSGGRLGYIHLPDTYNGSAREFPKTFYSQTRKDGLVVDGRFNGGGLDPDIFLQRLDKKPLAYWTRRYSATQTTPAVLTRAHMVCLTNRQAGSGGDMLPMEFQMKKMGPVIGTRTWGGLVGVSMFLDLVDGGGLTAPDYRIYDTEGKWIVENAGVTPDIEVDVHPGRMFRGEDAQLLKGVEVLQNKIRTDPILWPDPPPFPVETHPPGKTGTSSIQK